MLSGFVTLENLESRDDIFLVTLIINSESIATDESTSLFSKTGKRKVAFCHLFALLLCSDLILL